MAPYQVQSRYNFLRGSDFQHIRVYDRMLDAPAVATLARASRPAPWWSAMARAPGATAGLRAAPRPLPGG